MPTLTEEAILKSNREVEARIAEIRRQDTCRPVWLYLGPGIHLDGIKAIFGCGVFRVAVIRTRVVHKGWMVRVSESRGWLLESETRPSWKPNKRFKTKKDA